jgi:hypothetical protein
MDYLGLIDLSLKLIQICTISFIISLCLTLHAYVQTFDVIGVKKIREPNTPNMPRMVPGVSRSKIIFSLRGRPSAFLLWRRPAMPPATRATSELAAAQARGFVRAIPYLHTCSS